MTTVGKAICAARKRKKVTLEMLGARVGVVKSSLSAIENDRLKKPLNCDTINRIADVLDAPEILLQQCLQCPTRQHIIKTYYPELKVLRNDPALILGRLRQEMQKAIEAAEELGVSYLKADSLNDRDYRTAFNEVVERIFNVEKVVDSLKFELMLSQFGSLKEVRRAMNP